MHLFTNFLLFPLIRWVIFFISLPIYTYVPKEPSEGHASYPPKKTYIVFKILITTAISKIIMIFLIIIKFDFKKIFK